MPDNARRMYVTIHCRDDDRWSANVDTRDPTDVPKCATVILSRTQCHSWLSTVYGLYNKSTKVAVVLGLMLLARIILCSTTRLYAGSFVMLNGNCKLPNAPSVVLFLGQVTFLLVRASNNTTLSIFCLANLVILLSIIQIKCKTLGGHPIYRIIARDTAWVLCVLIRTFWSCSAKKMMVNPSLTVCGAIGLPGAARNKKYTHLLPGYAHLFFLISVSYGMSLHVAPPSLDYRWRFVTCHYWND